MSYLQRQKIELFETNPETPQDQKRKDENPASEEERKANRIEITDVGRPAKVSRENRKEAGENNKFSETSRGGFGGSHPPQHM